MADSNQSRVQPKLNPFRILYYTLKIWLLKSIVSVAFSVAQRIYPSAFPPADFKRRYLPLTSLETRIYLPPGCDVSNKKYPLFVNLHGGGMCFQIPDHGFASAVSARANIAVASVTYRTAPSHVFPTQIEDVKVIIDEILADTSLPIERTQGIVLGGISAGGLAAMGVAQSAQFKDVIRGVVSMYSVLDHTRSAEQRRGSRPKGPDTLDNGGIELFQWAYIPVGHDLEDPLLSPVFAKEEHLPRNIYFIVAELDILAGEQVTLAERILGERYPGEIVREENERVLRSVGGNQEVVCEVLKGMEHGVFEVPQKGWKGQSKEESLERLAQWLKKVFADA